MSELKFKYAAPATITITLASLATSATRVVGRESTAIDNSSNRYVDALVSGKITTGTTPTANQIDIWVYAQHDQSPTYMDVLDGTDSGETFTDEVSRNSSMRLLCTITTDTTSDQVYWMASQSVAERFGGVLPERWGIFIAHGTAVNLNSTGSNHEWKYQGITFETVG